jgi:hypothetical protein
LFRQHLFTVTKTDPEADFISCTRTATGPAEIVKQFFAADPARLSAVSGRALIDEMSRILEEGGFQGMVRFTKDHNVCDKCESNFVGSSDAESRYKVALEAEDTSAAAHWKSKLHEINQYQFDHMALHVSMHRFINDFTDLAREIRLDLMTTASCIEIVGEVSFYFVLCSYFDA